MARATRTKGIGSTGHERLMGDNPRILSECVDKTVRVTQTLAYGRNRRSITSSPYTGVKNFVRRLKWEMS